MGKESFAISNTEYVCVEELEQAWDWFRRFVDTDAAVWWLLVIPTLVGELWWWITGRHP